jgi:hypothetical protein
MTVVFPKFRPTASPVPQRAGKVTASRVADLAARTRTGYSASRGNYLSQVVAERLTGSQIEPWQSPAMLWGIQREPAAKAAYSFFRDVEVEPATFALHPTIELSGATPDGLVGPDGLVEFKCPTSVAHLETLMTGRIPERYQLQMLWQMACTGRSWCDYVSYDPRLPEALVIFVSRLERDERRIAVLEEEVRMFLFECDAAIAKLRRNLPGRSR